MEQLKHVLTESAAHTLGMLPFLFLVFLLVEFLSHSAKGRWVGKLTGHRFFGPIGAAILGLFPQCGFSVVATTMYVERLIPMGSLIAAYIATSDEAVPIMVANLSTARWVLPLLGTKLVLGACVGIAINLGVMAARGRARSVHQVEHSGHSCGSDQCMGQRAGLLTIMSHALSRTTKIAAMVFVISTFLNLGGHLLEGRFTDFLKASGPFQLLSASLVGLIPSCATSVALAESFTNGILPFPALLSGLTSNSGMGIAVLVKECRDKAEALAIIAVLVISGFLAGILASFLM